MKPHGSKYPRVLSGSDSVYEKRRILINDSMPRRSGNTSRHATGGGRKLAQCTHDPDSQKSVCWGGGRGFLIQHSLTRAASLLVLLSVNLFSNSGGLAPNCY